MPVVESGGTCRGVADAQDMAVRQLMVHPASERQVRRVIARRVLLRVEGPPGRRHS